MNLFRMYVMNAYCPFRVKIMVLDEFKKSLLLIPVSR